MVENQSTCFMGCSAPMGMSLAFIMTFTYQDNYLAMEIAILYCPWDLHTPMHLNYLVYTPLGVKHESQEILMTLVIYQTINIKQ